jgi:DNA-binding MarR family transcriptional regulator
LTDQGRREIARMRKVRTAQLAQRIAALDPADADRLVELLAVLETLVGED